MHERVVSTPFMAFMKVVENGNKIKYGTRFFFSIENTMNHRHFGVRATCSCRLHYKVRLMLLEKLRKCDLEGMGRFFLDLLHELNTCMLSYGQRTLVAPQAHGRGLVPEISIPKQLLPEIQHIIFSLFFIILIILLVTYQKYIKGTFK